MATHLISVMGQFHTPLTQQQPECSTRQDMRVGNAYRFCYSFIMWSWDPSITMTNDIIITSHVYGLCSTGNVPSMDLLIKGIAVIVLNYNTFTDSFCR